MNQQTVVLAGAGTMGASLAQVYAQAGYRTILHNRSQKGLQRARSLISLNQETMVRSKLLTQEVSAALPAGSPPRQPPPPPSPNLPPAARRLRKRIWAPSS